jgi:hypothetical protein
MWRPSVLVLLVLLLAAPASAESVRFVVVGDAGWGDEGQARVAAAMDRVCQERGGCDFGLMTGDNVYSRGAKRPDDPQWQQKLARPYAELGLVFYAVLGNHDYGAPDALFFLGGLGTEPARGQAQIDYAKTQSWLHLPAPWYRARRGPVELFALDTHPLYLADAAPLQKLLGFDGREAQQRRELRFWLDHPPAPWRLAFGHHPYLSNGPHGDAGSYGGLLGLVSKGRELKRFFDENLIGRVDVYVSGHDHLIQDLGDVGGTAILVSGGGSRPTERHDDRAVPLARATLGFLHVEADERRLILRFFEVAEDGSPSLVHERALLR